MSDIFSRSYRVQRQHSVDGIQWEGDFWYICMPSFPIINPFYRFTRYVEYDEYGNNPLVIEIGEMTPDGEKWKIITEPRDKSVW